MVNCSILGCKNRSERKSENITFHSYPSDIEARKLWIEVAGRKNWHPTEFSRVCSEHFEAHCLIKKKTYTIMNKGSIPKLFLPPPPMTSPAAVCVKEEPETSEWDGTGADEAAALFAEHEIKEELVFSPERLQPQDIAFAMQAKELSSRANSAPVRQQGSPGEASGVSCGTPVVLKYCFVRLERVRVDKDLYPCKICLKIFVLKTSFMTHTCLAKNRPSIIFKDIVDKTSFSCNACGKLFVTESKLKTHVLIHTTGKKNQLSCQLSSEQVLYKPEQAGRQKNQSGIKPYTCDICYSKFDKKTNLTKHRLIHAVEKLYTCHICIKQFTRKSFLDTHHQLVHIGQNPYTCNICNKQFTQRSSLFRHRSIHAGERSYTCDFCGKQFLKRPSFTSHRLIHTAEKPHICNYCNKTFSEQSSLHKHRLIDHKEKGLTCYICYRQFSYKSTLNRHLVVHRKEKSQIPDVAYTCYICNKRFLNKAKFTKHMSIHTVEKPQTCDICYKQFSGEYDLNKHMLIHAEGEPYTCNLCNSQFSLKYYLETHRLIHTQKLTLYI